MPSWIIFALAFLFALAFFIFLYFLLNRNTSKAKKTVKELPSLRDNLKIRRALKKGSWVQAPKKRVVRCSDGTPLEQDGVKVRCGEKSYPLVGLVLASSGYLLIVNDESGFLRYISFDERISFVPAPEKEKEDKEEDDDEDE